MRKFTDAELELAPQVAEIMGHGPDLAGLPRGMLGNYIDDYLVEHDCLEWLRERVSKDDIEIYYDGTPSFGPPRWHVSVGGVRVRKKRSIAITLLEALYRCITGKDNG